MRALLSELIFGVDLHVLVFVSPSFANSICHVCASTGLWDHEISKYAQYYGGCSSVNRPCTVQEGCNPCNVSGRGGGQS